MSKDRQPVSLLPPEERSVSDRTALSVEPTPEQVRYASILEKGMLLGLAILFVTYLLYVTGIAAPYLPPDTLAHYWGDGAARYLHEAEIPAGWGWVSMLRYGDFLNFVGIALLAGVTLICYACVLPSLWRRGDRVYAVLAVVQIAVLALAASGLLGSGGH
jgi:hypothetical protein